MVVEASAAGMVVCALIVLVAAWVRRRFVVVTIVGRSMEPTFVQGDRVLARRVSLDHVASGDVVVLTSTTGDWIIKRAVAVPGDPIPRNRVPMLASVAEAVVPPKRLVLLGDGAQSIDSRHLGYFDAGQLVGVVVRRLGHRTWAPAQQPARTS